MNRAIFETMCITKDSNIIVNLINRNIIINFDYEFAFCCACGNGLLGVAKYLMVLNQHINIHAYHENAFRYACVNGHLDTVKYLISLNQDIDIHILNDETFCRVSCQYEHFDIVEYLISLDMEYYLEFIIRQNMVEIATIINNNNCDYSFEINNDKVISYSYFNHVLK